MVSMKFVWLPLIIFKQLFWGKRELASSSASGCPPAWMSTSYPSGNVLNENCTFLQNRSSIAKALPSIFTRKQGSSRVPFKIKIMHSIYNSKYLSPIFRHLEHFVAQSCNSKFSTENSKSMSWGCHFIMALNGLELHKFSFSQWCPRPMLNVGFFISFLGEVSLSHF